jgi:GTP-binding protein Era
VAAAETTRCGYVALIGAPNAGKSTLLNTLVGSKIAIVTPKVQTTRSRIIGIALHGTAQIIFVDTPGIFEPRRRLDRAMVRAAWVGANDADVRVLLVDATRAKNGVADGESARIVADLRRTGTDAILALNKIDAVAKNSLLALAENSSKDGPFLAVFMISALAGDGLADLVDDLVARLPEGPWLYPEDQIAEVPLRQLAAEITREKLYLALRQELPYAATVETESWKERDDGSRSRKLAPPRASSWNRCWSAGCTCSSSSRCAPSGATIPNATAK